MEGCVKLFGCVIDVYLSHPLLMEAEPEAMRIRKDASLVDENVRVARVTRVTHVARVTCVTRVTRITHVTRVT